MSHFVVAVVHEPDANIEAMLEPYYEQVEEGHQSAEFNDCTEDLKEEYKTRTMPSYYTRSINIKRNSSLGVDIRAGNVTDAKFPLYASDIESNFLGKMDTGTKLELRALRRKNYASIFVEITTIAYKTEKDAAGKSMERIYMYTVQKVEPPVETPVSKLYPTIDDYATRYHGYTKRNDDEGNPMYGYVYNPKAKWDWWVVGGRWSGELRMKEDADVDLTEYTPLKRNDDIMKDYHDELGIEELATMEKKELMFNQLPLKDVDFVAMTGTDPEKLSKFWDEYVEGKNPEPHIKAAGPFMYKAEYYKELYGTKEAYIKDRSIWKPYAILSDTKGWLEKGEMGWFGMSSETADTIKDYDDAAREVLYKNPEKSSKVVTIVDCHI